MIPPGGIESRLRLSGILLMIGLAVEAISLLWSHPTAFLFFLIVGGLCMTVGILLYLYSIVSREKA